MRYDFTYIQALQSAARRERAEAVHRLVFAPLAALLRQSLRMPGCSSQGSSKASASSSPAGALG